MIDNVLRSLESRDRNESGTQKEGTTADEYKSEEDYGQEGSGLARAYSDAGYKTYHQKNYIKAVAYFREAIRLDPRSSETHKYLALSLWGLGELEEAKEYLEVTLKLNPKDVEARENLEKVLAQIEKSKIPG